MDELDGIGADVTGFVMAGGKSERFGSDKRRMVISGETLIGRTIAVVRELLGRDPFVVGDNLDGFAIAPEFVVNDARGDSGPLGGLVAAMERCETPWGLILAADLPNITVSDLRCLVNAADDSFDFISLSINAGPEPLAALYHKRTARLWREQLTGGRLTIMEGLKSLKCGTVYPPGGVKSLKNINRPDDLTDG